MDDFVVMGIEVDPDAMKDKPVKLTPTDKLHPPLMIPLVCSGCGYKKKVAMPGPHSRHWVTCEAAYHPVCTACQTDRMHPLSTEDVDRLEKKAASLASSRHFITAEQMRQMAKDGIFNEDDVERVLGTRDG